MDSTESVNGLPYWEFANRLCRLLNQLDGNSDRFLNERDRIWLKTLDRAFTKEVHHA